MQTLNILFLEPFYGGSHKAFADGLVLYSRHNIVLKTMPSRFWKWRMRGAALHFIHTVKNWDQYDLILISDLMSASDLKALAPCRLPPVIVYFHESQLSYPLQEGESMDYQFGFTDITSALAAKGILFNSHFHYNQFFNELPVFIRRMPDFEPQWTAEEIRKRSTVLYPGSVLTELFPGPDHTRNQRPLILWNHRWEFDKNPALFFRVLDSLDNMKIDFTLALLGENFSTVPKQFTSAREQYRDRILVYGYCKSRQEYNHWLKRADIVISTALQENFGLSIIEAIAAGAYPLLPDRLSYPEILPRKYHSGHIYSCENDLTEKLKILLTRGIPDTIKLAKASACYDWSVLINEYDEYFASSVIPDTVDG